MAERIDMEVKDPLEGFRFHEELIVAKREIAELYHPAIDVKVYRTFVDNPPSEIDTTARAYRDRDADAAVKGGLSQEAYDKLKPKRKIDYIAERSLSVNVSHEAAVASGKKTYQSVTEKYGEEYAEAFMENERGTYVGGVILKEGQAIMTDFKKGHAEVILNEGVRPEDLEIFEELTKYEYKDE
jgi:hypothetical protein